MLFVSDIPYDPNGHVIVTDLILCWLKGREGSFSGVMISKIPVPLLGTPCPLPISSPSVLFRCFALERL